MSDGLTSTEERLLEIQEREIRSRNSLRGWIIVASFSLFCVLGLLGYEHLRPIPTEKFDRFQQEYTKKHNSLYNMYKAGTIAIFGPGTVISEAGIKMLEILIESRKV